MKRLYGFILLLVAAVAPAGDQDVSRIYEKSQLARERPRLEGRVREMWREIFKRLPDRKKAELAGVQLEFPLFVKDQGPTGFYADGQNRKVILPILSLLFVEDLCTAYAWISAKGRRLEEIDEYVAMLRYRKAREFKGQRYSPPLQALRIPDNVLADAQVAENSLRYRNSAFAFILGHELGHIYHRHPGSEVISRKQARNNEEEADRFALEIMRRTATIPMGAMIYFQATAYYDGRAGEESNGFATHPLTTQRLQAMAKQLDENAVDFVVHNRNKAAMDAGVEHVRFIASGIAKIAKVLEDPELKQLMIQKIKKIDLSSWPQRGPYISVRDP